LRRRVSQREGKRKGGGRSKKDSSSKEKERGNWSKKGKKAVKKKRESLGYLPKDNTTWKDERGIREESSNTRREG